MLKEKKKGIVNVITLGFVSLLNDTASEMVIPIVPIFLTTVLGAPAYIVGLVEGIADAVSKLLMAFFGIVSDRKQKRKPFVAWGYGLATTSHLIMALASTWPVVLLARVINRTGKGVRTAARDALITESIEKEQRGKWFGFHRTMDSMGAVIGPLISIYLLKIFHDNYPRLFLFAFVPAFLGLLLLLSLVKEHPKEEINLLKMKFQWHKANDSYKIFLLISTIFALGNSSLAFLILRAQNLGLTVGLTIFTYVLLNLTYSIFSLPAGIEADKIGSKRVLFIGFLIFGFVYMLFGFINEAKWVWWLFPIYGVYLGLTDGVSKTYVSKLVPHEISASAIGIYETVMGVCSLLSSVIAGYLWSFMGARSPFYYGGIMAFIACFLFLTLTKRIKTIQPIA